MTVTLHSLDWIVITVYFLGIVAIGLYVSKRVKVTEDYFLGKRGFSVWLIIGQAFGVGTHAEMPVSLAGAVYKSGYSAIWYQWKNLFITPFYWILGPIFRRFRRTTIGEVYEDRYGNFMGAVYTVFALSYFTFNMGAMLKGAGKLVSVASGGSVTPNEVVVVMTVTFLAYSLVGGLVAAAYTDFVQSMFIIVLSFLLIPLGLMEIGGFAGMREALSADMLSMVTPGDVGVFTIVMLTINGLIGIVSQPHMLAAIGTGKDERSCRVGMAYGNFVKRFCTIGWALVGLIVVVMLTKSGAAPLADPEDAFGFATRELLFPGAVGLMIASVLAANMSTCSAFTVDGGALFTQNFYRRYLVSSQTDKHYLNVGRVAGATVTTLGVGFAIVLEVVLEAFLFTETIAAFMGISMFGAISWKRANRWGALSSLVTSSLSFFVLTYLEFGKLLNWDATNFGISMLIGFSTLIVVSLLTPREPETMLKPFYDRLGTRSELDEETEQEKEISEPGHDLLVVNLFHSGISKGVKFFYDRFRVDINGLVFAFGVVVAIIALAKFILYLP
ncbi:MAG: sodium:solute symporter family protein [bacterium]|nr:sodium:solute symporter family protein [bacterium]